MENCLTIDSLRDVVDVLLETVSSENAASVLNRNDSWNRLARSPASVRPSSTHGRGLFADRNINRGEVVSMYPGDVYWNTKDRDDNDKQSVKASPRVSNKRALEMLGDISYRAHVEDFCVVGDELQSDDAWFVGHFANDGSILSNADDDEKNYIAQTASKRNADFELVSMDHFYLLAVVAQRDIIKDEEIFIAYGVNYWKLVNRKSLKTVDE
jgi:hypothetical protein